MKLRSPVIWTADQRRRLEAQACAPAGLGLTREPAVISAFRRAAEPAAVTRTCGAGLGCAEPDIEQDILAHGHAFSRPAQQPSGQRRRSPLRSRTRSLPQPGAKARAARAAMQPLLPKLCPQHAGQKLSPAIAATKPGRLTPPVVRRCRQHRAPGAMLLCALPVGCGHGRDSTTDTHADLSCFALSRPFPLVRAVSELVI